MMYVIIRLLHLAAILVFAGTLVIANMATKPSITGEDVENLAKVDLVGSLAAILTFFLGLTLWMWVGKPAEFYSSNPVFHAKVGLFFLLILLALLRKFLFRQSSHVVSDTDCIAVPTSVRVLLRIELVILVILPILAFLAARGIGVPTAG